MPDTSLTGGCLCGAVRYRAPAPPIWAAHCHCASCRKAAGAPFVTWAGFGRGAVAWEGEPQRYASSPGVVRSFCPTCGTPLAYESERWPDETHILAATLDAPDAVRPTAHLYWGEHLAWIEPGDGLRRLDTTLDDDG